MIRIIVDSSADYLPEELEQKNIDLVPLRITIGDNTYIEGENLTRNQFYEILEATGEFPKTSQPSPQDLVDIFEDAKEKGDSVICVLLSSALSGTYQSAVLSKEMADYDDIYLVDSLSATFGIRIMVEHACKLRQQGASAQEIAETLESLKSRIKIVAALDTLEYLARGGRISKAVASIGELANLKPIITVTPEGTVGVIGKCIGKNKAIAFLRKAVQKESIDFNYDVYTLYSYGKENITKLEEKFTQDGIIATNCLQIGATIGAHVGPGAFGIIYIEK